MPQQPDPISRLTPPPPPPPAALPPAALPDPFNDSIAFRAGQQEMARRTGELLRHRRSLVQQLPAHHSGVLAIASELDLLIRAVDSLATPAE